LDGIKGNFAVSKSEYLAVNHLQKSGSEPKLIYTNVKEMVEAQQFLFDNLWNRGINAEQTDRNLGIVKRTAEKAPLLQVHNDISGLIHFDTQSCWTR